MGRAAAGDSRGRRAEVGARVRRVALEVQAALQALAPMTFGVGLLLSSVIDFGPAASQALGDLRPYRTARPSRRRPLLSYSPISEIQRLAGAHTMFFFTAEYWLPKIQAFYPAASPAFGDLRP